MKILEEKLDKERLLNIAASSFDGSFNLVNAVTDVDNPDKEGIKQVLDNEKVLKSFIDLERTLEMTAKFSEDKPPFAVRARVWYAIILILHNRKVPDALNQKIAENKAETMNYYNFLKERGLAIPDVIYDTYKKFKNNINESLNKKIINEKLDKEKLVTSILKDSSASLKFVKKKFFSNNIEPPKEFFNPISQSPYTSNEYLRIAIGKNMKVPRIIAQGILKNIYMVLDIIKDPKLKKLFSEKDLEAVISKDSYASFDLYTLYKKENKKIPPNIIRSILDNPSTSFNLAKDYIARKKTIPDIVFRALSANKENIFILAIEMLKANLDLPDIMLRILIANLRISYKFEDVLFQYAEQDKEIPQTLLDAVAKENENLSSLCFKLASKGIKIPEGILNIFIEKTPKSGSGFLGEEAYILLSYYLKKESNSKFENIPTNLYTYIVESGYISYIRSLVESFLRKFGKVPKEFKKAILDHYDQYSERKHIPKDIADAIGININESTIITEKLDKDRLMYMAVKETPVAIDLLTQLAYTDKDIPDLLSRVVAERSGASICARVASYIIAYSDKEVPEPLLEKIATNRKIANDIAFIYKNNRKEIPDIIKNVLSKKNREFYEDDIWNFGATTNTINEALDKEKLLDVISKDEEAYIQILRHYFLDKNELPPENLIDMASKDVAAAIIFAEYCLEYKKEIRPDIIEKIAEYPRGAYTIASLMKIEDRDVPEILTNSIKKDPLSLKHYEEFLTKQHVPLNTKVYLKI